MRPWISRATARWAGLIERLSLRPLQGSGFTLQTIALPPGIAQWWQAPSSSILCTSAHTVAPFNASVTGNTDIVSASSSSSQWLAFWHVCCAGRVLSQTRPFRAFWRVLVGITGQPDTCASKAVLPQTRLQEPPQSAFGRHGIASVDKRQHVGLALHSVASRMSCEHAQRIVEGENPNRRCISCVTHAMAWAGEQLQYRSLSRYRPAKMILISAGLGLRWVSNASLTRTTASRSWLLQGMVFTSSVSSSLSHSPSPVVAIGHTRGVWGVREKRKRTRL